MTTPLHERRGLNRQQAIEYLGIKGTFFDKMIRPMLAGIRMGTSVIFDRRELDAMFERIKLECTETVGPIVKGETPPTSESWDSLKQKKESGKSTKPTRHIDFRDVLKHIRQQKTDD